MLTVKVPGRGKPPLKLVFGSANELEDNHGVVNLESL